MANNKPVNFGPVALIATTTTNIFNPPTLTGGTGLHGTNANTFMLMRHLRVANKTNGAIFFALWKGATGANAAGTEHIASGVATAGALNANTGVSVPANSYFDWYGYQRYDVADFLVGGASALGLTIEGEGEIGIV